jgi:hypothetical protein
VPEGATGANVCCPNNFGRAGLQSTAQLSAAARNAANTAHASASLLGSGDAKAGAVKQYIVGGLAAALTVGGLIAAAPPASAGCQSGRPWCISQCDGPVQPDGTWQRCVTFPPTNISIGGSDSYTNYTPDTRCDVMGPDLHPWVPPSMTPPTHIDN